jgi:hypothetical protein
MISLYIDNALSISYFCSIDYIKSIGFFFILKDIVSIDYLWKNKVFLSAAVDKGLIFIDSDFNLYL